METGRGHDAPAHLGLPSWGRLTGTITGIVRGALVAIRRFTDINYYALLGVSSDASRTTIRAAYRVKVREANPDHGGDPEVFAQIAEAWEVLGNADERALYDADRSLRLRTSRPNRTRLPRDEEGRTPRTPPPRRATSATGDSADRVVDDDVARADAAADRFTDREQWMKNKRRL